MSAHWLEDPLDAAPQDDPTIEVRATAYGLFVHIVSGKAEKAAAVARIAARQRERERLARDEGTRRKREALGRSNARPARRGGAA